MSFARRVNLSLASAVVGLAVAGQVGAGPVLAHIDPDPTEAPAGSEVSVGFTVEHGCEGSPTVELRMRLPEGVTGSPEPPAGWTGAVEDDVVSFTGGPLADDIEETFRVRMTLPLAEGTTIYFPFVQRCEVGEIAWIDTPDDASDNELDEPAPAMTLTAALPAAPTTVAGPTTTAPSDTAAPTTAAPTTTAAADSTIPATIPESAPATTEPPTTDVPVSADTLPATTEADDSRGNGSGGTVVLLVTLAVVVAGGAVVLTRARRRAR